MEGKMEMVRGKLGKGELDTGHAGRQAGEPVGRERPRAGPGVGSRAQSRPRAETGSVARPGSMQRTIPDSNHCPESPAQPKHPDYVPALAMVSSVC